MSSQAKLTKLPRRAHVDEILIIGHSLGAAIAADLLARVLVVIPPSANALPPRVPFGGLVHPANRTALRRQTLPRFASACGSRPRHILGGVSGVDRRDEFLQANPVSGWVSQQLTDPWCAS